MKWYDFEWPVHSRYELVPTSNPSVAPKQPGNNLLIRPVGARVDVKRHLENFPTMFKRLAETPKDPGDVLKFAESYGLLWSDLHRGRKLDGGSGEHVKEWFYEIEKLKFALRMNEAAPQGIAPRDSFITADVEIRELKPSKESPSRGVVRPRSLLAAIWIQFVDHCSLPHRQWKRCESCPEWFFYGSGTGHRETARYCSKKCQDAAAYQRRKAAQQQEESR